MNSSARRTNGTHYGMAYGQDQGGINNASPSSHAGNQPVIEAMTEINGRMFEHMATINTQWMAFLQRSFQDSLSLPQQLGQCRTPQDAMRVYGEFVQHSMQSYQAEVAKMARLGQAITTETTTLMRDKVEETARAIRP